MAYEEDADSVRAIVNALEDEEYLVVLGALETVADTGRPEFVQHVAPKTRHPNAWVRRQACVTLGGLWSDEGIPDLLMALGDEDADVRREAVKALTMFEPTPEILGALVEAVGDKDAGVSFAAAEGLSDLTGEQIAHQQGEGHDGHDGQIGLVHHRPHQIAKGLVGNRKLDLQ